MFQRVIKLNRINAKWIFALMLFSFWSAHAIAANPPSRTQTQRTTQQNLNYYAKARVYFESGYYPQAIQYAAADLRKNPARKASAVIMAQSYYRMGRVNRSAKLFSKIPFEELPPDAALDYTLAMFSAKNFKAASTGWQKVPEDHPYKDVAKFYSGIAYMQLKQYLKASQLLRSARKLPANLKSERRQLIDKVDALMESERSGRFSQEQTYAYQAKPRFIAPPPLLQPPTSPVQPGAPGAPPAKPQADKKSDKPAPPASGFSFTATPTFTYESVNDSVDRNGYSLTQIEKKTPAKKTATKTAPAKKTTAKKK